MSKTPQEEITALRYAFNPPSRTPEENKALCEKYPFLTWYGDPLYFGYTEENGPNYDYTWEDEIPAGWRAAFCPKIWDELKAILVKYDCLKDFSFMQIKEKYGTLTMYFSGLHDKVWKKVLKWEQKYSHLSEKYCINCGRKTSFMTLGWIGFICKDCQEARDREAMKKYQCHDWAVPIKDLKKYYKDPRKYREEHFYEPETEEEKHDSDQSRSDQAS